MTQFISSVTFGMRWRTVEVGLTWSRSPRSGGWKGSAPPYGCGGQWACSQSWCSGSAAPLPDFFCFLCFFLQEIAHGHTRWQCSMRAENWCTEEKRKIVHESKLEKLDEQQSSKKAVIIFWQTLTFGESHEAQEHHNRKDNDFDAHHPVLFYF